MTLMPSMNVVLSKVESSTNSASAHWLDFLCSIKQQVTHSTMFKATIKSREISYPLLWEETQIY